MFLFCSFLPGGEMPAVADESYLRRLVPLTTLRRLLPQLPQWSVCPRLLRVCVYRRGLKSCTLCVTFDCHRWSKLLGFVVCPALFPEWICMPNSRGWLLLMYCIMVMIMPIIKHSMLYTVLDFSCFVVLHLDISVGVGTRNICTHARTLARSHACTHARTRTHARTHTRTHTHTHMPQLYTHGHALGYTRTRARLHTHTHTHTHTHARTHTHTHTPAYTRRYNGVRDTDWVSHDLIRQTRGRENSTGTSSTECISPLSPSSVPPLLDCKL